MLSKQHRLPRSEFRSRGYRAITTPFFSLKTKDNSLGVNRIGVVVGKSVDNRAVQRNMWERQGKQRLLEAPIIGKDFILTIFPKVKTLTKSEFAAQIKKIVSKLE